MNPTRIYFYGTDGCALFYLELEYSLDKIILSHSLRIEINQIPGFESLCASVTESGLPEAVRIARLKFLGEKIKNSQLFKRCFFPLYLLDKNGEFNEEYSQALYSIINQNFPDYTMFSQEQNFANFDFILPFFYSKILEAPIYVEKEHFLELISDQTDLQVAYVEFLDENNEFYYYQVKDDCNVFFDFYFLTIQNELKFFFVKLTPQPG